MKILMIPFLLLPLELFADMITPILRTSILVNEDGTGTFINSEFSEHSHNGLSLEDIAYIEAMEVNKNLEIDLRKQINEMPNDDTIVYTYKHDTGEITIFTVISME